MAITAYLKIFVGAAKDRLEVLQGCTKICRLRHVRAILLLVLVLGLDVAGVVGLWTYTKGLIGWRLLLLLGTDAAVIAVKGLETILHYGESSGVAGSGGPTYHVSLTMQPLDT